MNKLDKQYTDLLQDIIDNGVTKQDRTGTGTLSVFGRQIRHKMSEGFPLITTKKIPFKTIVTELLWFLRGDTNIKFLVDNGCHIWDGDAYKNYEKAFNEGKVGGLSPMVKGVPDEIIPKEDFIEMIKDCDKLGSEEFAKKWGELGPIYGKQWRNWKQFKTIHVDELDKTEGIYKIHSTEFTHTDQISNSINLLKTDPDSRRNRVNAWNVGELDQMVLPPCHTDFQFFTRELSLEERVQLIRNTPEYRNFTEELWKKYIDTTSAPTRAISLMWNQRSVDTFLGLPFNIASYGLLLEIIAKEVNMVPDELIGNLGDVHLYSNHIEQAKEQIGRELSLEERTELARGKVVPLLGSKEDSYDEAGIAKRTREPFPLPKLKIKQHSIDEPSPLTKPQYWHPDDFIVENYQSHPSIKAPLSN
jgi:thymidylate synthase